MRCNACKHEHPATQRCEHAARLRAAKNVVNKPVVNAPVINKAGPVDPPIRECRDGPSRPSGGDGGGERPTRQTAWQRKNKDRYNAKMREYMKERRARKPLGIAHG